MKNNFFMCSLMAFCLFSLQTINTSEVRLFNAIVTGDDETISQIVRQTPLIVGKLVPALKSLITFRDLAILYDNARLMKEINEILASKQNIKDSLMITDFKNGTEGQSIPLDAAVLLNSSPDMIKQITRWNSFSPASFDSDTKRRLPKYFKINVSDLLKMDSRGNLPQELPQELKKAGAYIRRLLKASGILIDESAVSLDPKDFPWMKREIPIFASNKDGDFKKVSKRYRQESVPRLVLRPVINLGKLVDLQNILDIEEKRKFDEEFDEERREIIEAEIKARDEIARVLRIDKEALRIQEAQRMEAERRMSDFFDRSLSSSPYHTKRIE